MGARFPLAFGLNIAFALVAVGVIGATSFAFVPKRMQAIAMVGMVPVLIAVQGTVMVRLIRDGYRRRGWRVRKD